VRLGGTISGDQATEHPRLLWSEGDGRLFVDASDAKTGDAFWLAVHDHSACSRSFTIHMPMPHGTALERVHPPA